MKIEISKDRLKDRYLLHSLVCYKLNEKAPDGTTYDFDSSHIIEANQVNQTSTYYYLCTPECIGLGEFNKLYEVELRPIE